MIRRGIAVWVIIIVGIIGALILAGATSSIAVTIITAILVSEGVLISLIPVLISSIIGVNKQLDTEIIKPELAKWFLDGMISVELTLVVSFILLLIYSVYSVVSYSSAGLIIKMVLFTVNWFLLGIGLGLLFASLGLFAFLLYDLRWRDKEESKRNN
jgi:hypothetical protein